MAHGFEVIGSRCPARTRGDAQDAPFDLLRVPVAEPEDGVLVLAPAGEVDISTAPVLRRAVHDAVEADPRAVVVDLSGLTFCGSTGLVELIEARDLAGLHGVGFGTAGGRPIMLRVLAITGFGPAIGHCETLTDALEAVAGEAVTAS